MQVEFALSNMLGCGPQAEEEAYEAARLPSRAFGSQLNPSAPKRARAGQRLRSIYASHFPPLQLQAPPEPPQFGEPTNGQVYRHDPKSSAMIGSVDKAAFYQLKGMMQGVLARGTARSIANLAPYVAGRDGRVRAYRCQRQDRRYPVSPDNHD